jgi:hypothetical protein
MAEKGFGAFWIGWNLSTGSQAAWKDWAKDNKIPLMPVNELHCTEFYAPNEPADKKWPEPMQAAFTCRANGVARLGKALVVLFDAPQFVTSRFTQLQSEYEHSFASFIPHMSLFYSEPGAEGAGKQITDELIGKLNADIGTMPSLVFQNQEVNAPKDSLSTAALVYMDTCGLYDIAKHKDNPRGKFLSAFGKALAEHPGLVEAWASGDKNTYRAEWVKVLAALSSMKV